jgi:uncharacterized membrane protein
MSRGFSFSLPKPPVAVSLSMLAFGAIAIAIFLRILNLGSREFWYDEVLSLLLSTGQKIAYRTPGEVPVNLADYTPLLSLPVETTLGDILITLRNLLRGVVGSEPHPPLLFFSQHLWLRLFGNSEVAMRSLGVLMSVGAIAAAYGLGRCLLGNRGGLLFAALLATNPYYLFHSLNVRMYGSLMLWTILSAWALLELIGTDNKILPDSPMPQTKQSSLLWSLVLIASVASGLLTFYLFAYWVIALSAIVLVLDRRHWWLQGLRLGSGVLLTLPWVWWGTRQQLRNADLGRFTAKEGFITSIGQHLQDVLQTLGIHLVLGDWVSSLPPVSATVAGIVAIAILGLATLQLWQQGEHRRLGIALLLGIFPLLLALLIDIVSRKFTLGFGWGRSMIVILPGCLLLLAVWIERATGQWRQSAAAILLLLYLSISISDFSGRSRGMFHQIAGIIQQEPTTPTLVVMNSQAWGHVMRLAYYIPPSASVKLLAQSSAELAPALDKTLKTQASEYPRILWLNSTRPIWGTPKTEAEKQQHQQAVERLLSDRLQLKQTTQLSGTMEIDKFTLKLYTRSL